MAGYNVRENLTICAHIWRSINYWSHYRRSNVDGSGDDHGDVYGM